jgi:MFS family permease
MVSEGRLGDHPGFWRFWTASTVSDFGTYVTTVALPVLLVVDLHASATDVGLVSAARWLPYLVLGVLVGVLADRIRRRPVLVATDLLRAGVVMLVPVCGYLQVLSVPLLIGVMAVFGLLSLANDAAHQSFLPALVPKGLLTLANARIQQSDSAALTSGPLLAGALISWVGAPLALVWDAASYIASGLLTATIGVSEYPVPPMPDSGGGPRSVLSELREGLAWVYLHRRLMPLAVSTHAWFLFFSIPDTAYAPFALRDLHLGAFGLGATLALAGLGGLIGASVSTRLTARTTVPRIIVGSWLAEAVGFSVVALSAWPASGPQWALPGAGQFLVGLGMGAGGPVQMSYRQNVTPLRLQGRMNTTMRSLNRAAVVVGAPLGGLIADSAGYRPALWTGVAGIATAAALLNRSAFRHATLDEHRPAPNPES